MKSKLPLKTGDIILMLIIAISAIVTLTVPFFKENSEIAQIVIAETGENKSISLNSDNMYKITSLGVTLTVCVKNGEAYVSDSTCRDSICKNTPPISRSGQSIVCAPAGVIVRITGEEAQIDAISG